MRVVVSGVNGFVGAHLVDELIGHGHQVVGLGTGPAASAVRDQLDDYVDQDLSVAWPDAPADAIVHLAGLSAVGPSFAAPQRYLTGNSAPLTNLFEGLLSAGSTARVITVSTGAVYEPGTAVTEASPTRASSPYAVSKLVNELQCQYYRNRGLDVTIMRPFNHIGPGQQGGFILPDLIAGVRHGDLTVGDLDTRRDYTDVRDVARAYRLAVEAPQIAAPVLNVCSGISVSGRELLDLVVRALDVPPPRTRTDSSRFRPGDPAEIRGVNALIAATLDWLPVIDIETSVADAAAHSVAGHPLPSTR